MFRVSSCPSSGATTAAAASGLPSELGDSSVVGRGRADPSCWLIQLKADLALACQKASALSKSIQGPIHLIRPARLPYL